MNQQNVTPKVTNSGFIRDECFDPKKWIIPEDRSMSYALSEELLHSTRIIYVRETRNVKSKRVADACC
jgi:endoribonuclease Dicer